MGLKTNDKAVGFELKGTDGNTYSLESFKDKKLLAVIFFCNHCPYANAYEERIKKIQEDFKDNLQIVAINSNDASDYPEDDFDHMVSRHKDHKFNFVYVVDETQEIARAYGGEVTPDIFLFDEQRNLKYRGRIDDSWDNPDQVTQEDFRNAIESLLKNQEVPVKESRAIGCSIKWGH